jgi:hypothetical protein
LNTQPSLERQDGWLLAAALVCGAVHHIVFYEHAWGVSVPLFIGLFYAMFFWAYQGREGRTLGPSAIVLVAVALLSFTYGLFSNTLFRVLNTLAVPGLVLLHTVWMVRGSRFEPTKLLGLMAEQVLFQTISNVSAPIKLLFRSMTSRMSSRRSKELVKVLTGLLISIPLLALVVSLLASADTMFDRSLSRLPELLEGLEAGELLFRGLWIVLVAVLLFAYMKGLLYPKPFGSAARKETEAGVWEPDPLTLQTSSKTQPLIDPTIAATLLVVLNAVYLLFAFVQFSYFFGGGSSALPEGVTYAEYARKGFGELVTVTVINFTVLMIMLYGVNRTGINAYRLLRLLLAVLIGSTGVMLSSAYLRLSMYEEAYGYTVTRILVHAFMLFLLVLFVIALYKLWKPEVSLIKPYLAVALLAYVALNYLNVDGIIARSNMERYETTGRIDVNYLGSLSYEVVPSLVELKRKHPEVGETDEVLRRMRERLMRTEDDPWFSFNWSEWQARKLLSGKE